MSSRSRRHFPEEHDNPAWPGLVDLFAFGMVIILLLWAQAASLAPPPQVPEPEKGLGGDEKKVEDRLRTIEGLLETALKGSVDDVFYAEDPQRVEIRTGIRFGTQKYQLSADQQEKVRTVCNTLILFVDGNDETLLVISGKADPRQFQNNDPPRDNIELSALRAAEISRILFNSGVTKKLQERISVRGLGDRGGALLSDVNQTELEKLRTVTFEVHVDKAKLDDAEQREQKPPRAGQP